MCAVSGAALEYVMMMEAAVYNVYIRSNNIIPCSISPLMMRHGNLLCLFFCFLLGAGGLIDLILI
jgi:hypothetical protein